MSVTASTAKQSNRRLVDEHRTVLLDAVQEDFHGVLAQAAMSKTASLPEFILLWDQLDLAIIHAFVSPANLDLAYGLVFDFMNTLDYLNGGLYLLYLLHRTSLTQRPIPVSMATWDRLVRVRESRTLPKNSDWDRCFDWLVRRKAFSPTLSSAPLERWAGGGEEQYQQLEQEDQARIEGGLSQLAMKVAGCIERIAPAADRYEQLKNDEAAPAIATSQFAALLRQTLPRPVKPSASSSSSNSRMTRSGAKEARRRSSSLLNIVSAVDDMPAL